MIINESVKFNPDQFLSLLSLYSNIDDAYMKLYGRGKLPSGAACNRTNNSIEVQGYRFKPKRIQISKNPPKFKYGGKWTYSKM